MKIRDLKTLRLLGRILTPLVSLCARTFRVELDNQGQDTDPWNPQLKQRYVYAMWHESLIGILALRAAVPAHLLKQAAPGAAIVSQSGHGDLAAYLCDAFGIRAIRGSSTRGGYDAAEEIIASLVDSHLMVAPDGPQGPRREVKRGISYLASWTGKSIVPLGLGFSRAKRLKTWDHLAIPYLFSQVKIITGPILHIPPGIGRKDSERYRDELQYRMDEAQRAAALWAGEAPEPSEISAEGGASPIGKAA